MSLNRLFHLSAYLSGAIDFSKDNGRSWREEITPFLEDMGVTVYNPLNPIFDGMEELDGVMRPKIKQMIENEQWEELRVEVKKIVRADLHMVDLSSFMIVNYDVDIKMCGTHEEMFNALNQNKPVLLVVKSKKKLPLWIYGRVPTRSHVFEGWDKLKEYLTGINSNPDFKFDVADTKRWMFLSGEHMNP